MKDETSAGLKKGHRPVKRRRVIYLHGYDPATSDRYRRLIARAGADRGGEPPAMTPVGSLSPVSQGWRIDAKFEGQRVETVFEILRYEDVVRHWQKRPVWQRIWTGLGSWGRFIATGSLSRVWSLSKGPAGLFFHPILILGGFLLLGNAAGRELGELAERYGAPDWSSQLGRVVGISFGLWLSLRLEKVFFGHLMLSLFDFMVRIAEDKAPAGRLTNRIDAFADRIVECVAEANRNKVDEILIVGHSLGAVVATQALAMAIERDVDLAGGRAKIGFLTLGSVGGYIACRQGPGADDYSRCAFRIAMNEDIRWVDVSSPRDWFSFGLIDPLLMADAPPKSVVSPLVISAKFGKFRPDPEDRRTRFRAMGLHMKYLGAPDRKGGFDFFAVAAGPQTLEARYENRRHSPNAKMLIS